jgi:hypothetical protein
MLVRHVAALCLISSLTGGVMNGQTAAGSGSTAEQIEGGTPSYIKAETPEQRKARLGTIEDPGINPDGKKVWSRFGQTYTIDRFDRQWAAYDQAPGVVRPRMDINFGFEIYQQNEKYVWVWMPTMEALQSVAPPSNDSPAEKSTRYTAPQLAYLRKIAPEFREIMPPASSKIIRFEESSQGLPTSGSWRNSAAVADMNGDGFADIVVPPERGPAGPPQIFLGDGKGTWKIWRTVWPYPLQYGNAVVADFNNDKKMDVAFGVHLTGVRVFLGNGAGEFTEANEGLEAAQFSTRRIVVTDVNADGQPDILGLYEGPSPGIPLSGARVKAFLNVDKAKSWKVVDAVANDNFVAGDWFATGKFNADRYPDFVSSNSYFQRPDVLFESHGAAKWKMVDHRDGELVPYLSSYTAVTAGRFGSASRDDAIMSYQRSWPGDVDETLIPKPPAGVLVGIDRISFSGKRPERTPIVRLKGERAITGLAAADFDGDGKNDLLFTRFDPREAMLLLGNGRGAFNVAALTGLALEPNTNYDLNVADVNGDKLPDVILMYESNADSVLAERNGSIRVFLNRGTGPRAAAETALRK